MRWDTSELRELMIQGLPEDLTSECPRRRAKAREVVLAMESQNQKDQHKKVDVSVATRHDQLSGIAADLGVEISVVENAQAESSRSTESDESASVEVANDGA